MKVAAKLWIGLGILVILSPVGLILPEHFKAGPPWGEQGGANIWNAPIPDYAFKGWEEKGLPHLSLAYIISAAAGIIITVLLVMGIGKLLTKKKDLKHSETSR
ncbi:MAG: PDGLE domain-containing protein [Candidatus Omnitrophota bacterium]|nr:PDGLE domain-containing protein [Candidatus Omnitrophota bacterium]